MTNGVGADGRSDAESAWRLQVQVELARAGLMREHDAWADCQNPDTTRCYVVCPTDPTHYGHPVRNTCHLRVCPDCARRASARLLTRYLPAMRKVTKQRIRAYRLKHIVLTTNLSLHDGDVREKVRWAFSCVGKVFDAYFGRRWTRQGMGYIVAAEFGEQGTMLHFHILFYGPFIVKDRLSELWKGLTGSSVVWIQAVKAGKQDVEAAAVEVLKYATKLTQVSPADIPVLLMALKGTRRIRSRGVFYNMPKAEERERVCPVCGETLVLWSPFRWETWLLSHPKAVLTPDYYQLGMLDLIRGNKSDSGAAGEMPSQHEAGQQVRGNAPPRATPSPRRDRNNGRG